MSSNNCQKINSLQATVSIITASFNKAGMMAETIQSVLSQTYQKWEYILVDDASTDNSVEIISRFTKDPRIRLLCSDKNRGANYCRNLGLANAYGKYILFLDADDLLTNECLERRIAETQKSPDVNCYVFTMGVFYKQIGDDNRRWTPNTNSPLKDFLQHKLPWSIVQPLWSKELLQQLNGFDETFKRLQDVELNTRALLHPTLKLKMVGGEPDCYYRIDESRKNFTTMEFLQRWVDSSCQYCNKFQALVPDSHKKYLYGTLYEIYLQLMHRVKSKAISMQEFNLLVTEMLEKCHLRISGFRKLIWNIARLNNLGMLKIPGLNRVLKRILIG